MRRSYANGSILGNALHVLASLLFAALAFISGGVSTVSKQVSVDFSHLTATCAIPIEYSLGSFDGRFGLSRSAFSEAVATAAARWQKSASKPLFSFRDNGALKLNLVYDERQQETEMLAKIGLTINQDQASFDTITETYKNLLASYNEKKAAYARAIADFQTQQLAYQNQVTYWNSRGGAPADAYANLTAMRNTLEAETADLTAQVTALNTLTKTLNGVAAVLNQLADSLNIQIDRYNTGGQDIRKVFEAGDYESDSAGERINIYQFENNAKLVAVLTHELGHALGLEHNDSPKSIMYRLNEGQNQTITAADIAALKAKCPELK